MVTPGVPTSARVKTTQASRRRRLARIHTDNIVQGFRISPKANIGLHNEMPELYQPFSSHSSSARVRVFGGPSPTIISLQGHFFEEITEEITLESEDNVRTPPFIEDTGASSDVANQVAVERSGRAHQSAIEMMAQSVMESPSQPWTSRLDAMIRDVVERSSRVHLSALEMATQNAMENLRESWTSQLGAMTWDAAERSSRVYLSALEMATQSDVMTRDVVERSSRVHLSALEMATQNAMENLREPWTSQLGAMTWDAAERSSRVYLSALEMATQSDVMTRDVVERSSRVHLSALEMATQSAMENLRESWTSQLGAMTWDATERSSRVHLSALEMATQSDVMTRHVLGGGRTWGYDRKATLLAHLRHNNREQVADRIQHFFDRRDQDPDEPPIVIESLRSLVSFIIQEPRLSPPIIGSDPKGRMEIEWHLHDNGNPDSVWGRGNGVVSMKFLESGVIQFVALSGPHIEGQDRLRIQDQATGDDIITKLGEFVRRVTIP